VAPCARFFIPLSPYFCLPFSSPASPRLFSTFIPLPFPHPSALAPRSAGFCEVRSHRWHSLGGVI